MPPPCAVSVTSSLLNESGKWNPDAIEAQLAHVEGNAVRRTYARAEFWDEQVRMMDWCGATSWTICGAAPT
jgi:hypothetical protein